MAVVSDVIATVSSRTVFTKPPDFMREKSPLPRAMVNFTVLDGVISAKPTNDQAELTIQVVLPGTFAYRLVDFTVSLVQDLADDWIAKAYIEIQNGVKNLPTLSTQRHSCGIDKMRKVTGGAQTKMWIARDASNRSPPGYLIQANHNETADFSFIAVNEDAAAAAAGTCDALFTFFEYELEQAEYVALYYAGLAFSR